MVLQRVWRWKYAKEKAMNPPSPLSPGASQEIEPPCYNLRRHYRYPLQTDFLLNTIDLSLQ